MAPIAIMPPIIDGKTSGERVQKREARQPWFAGDPHEAPRHHPKLDYLRCSRKALVGTSSNNGFSTAC
jgi:hypothetical protein